MAAPDLTPAERTLRAKLASHTSWANTSDRRARTAPGTRASLDRFERQVDPDGTLPPEERAQRAESAKKAYFTALALKSATSRRRKAEARRLQNTPTSPLTNTAEADLKRAS